METSQGPIVGSIVHLVVAHASRYEPVAAIVTRVYEPRAGYEPSVDVMSFPSEELPSRVTSVQHIDAPGSTGAKFWWCWPSYPVRAEEFVVPLRPAPEVNREDPEGCEACAVAADEGGVGCLYHEGTTDGVNAALGAVEMVVSDPNTLIGAVERAVAERAARVLAGEG